MVAQVPLVGRVVWSPRSGSARAAAARMKSRRARTAPSATGPSARVDFSRGTSTGTQQSRRGEVYVVPGGDFSAQRTVLVRGGPGQPLDRIADRLDHGLGRSPGQH